MQQQLTLNLNLDELYFALDDAGKAVLLDVLTSGISNGFVRDMLVQQWTEKAKDHESQGMGTVSRRGSGSVAGDVDNNNRRPGDNL